VVNLLEACKRAVM